MFTRLYLAEEGSYWAEVSALPGCVTEGETIDEVIANLQDAIEGWLEVAKGWLGVANKLNAVEPSDRAVGIAV